MLSYIKKTVQLISYHALIAASIAYFAPVATASYISLNILGLNTWIGSLGYNLFATTMLRYMAQSIALEFALPLSLAYIVDTISTRSGVMLNKFNIVNSSFMMNAITNIGLGYLLGPKVLLSRELASIPGGFYAAQLDLKPEYNSTPITMISKLTGLDNVISTADTALEKIFKKLQIS